MSKVQSVVFSKDYYTIKEAKKWLKKNNFKYDDVDVKPNTIRFRQHDPASFTKFRVKAIDDNKIILVIGFTQKQGGFKPKTRYIVMKLKPDKGKRYKFLVMDRNTLKNEKVKFGSKKGSTYIDHKDPVKKKNYIARHSKLNEDWEDPFTAGFWARWYLWSEPNLEDVEKLLARKFDITFIN